MLLLKNVPNICGREIRNFRVQDAESGIEELLRRVVIPNYSNTK
jgi:hypothetical protein